jgi:hypothetical protein
VIVSVVAICVAVVSLLLALRADRRAARLEKGGRQANPIVTSRGTSGSGQDLNYAFDVYNDGPATITRVELWIADHEGRVISTGDTRDLVLRAGESIPLSVKIVNPEIPSRVVWIRWRDLEGLHEKPNPEVYVQPL